MYGFKYFSRATIRTETFMKQDIAHPVFRASPHNIKANLRRWPSCDRCD